MKRKAQLTKSERRELREMFKKRKLFLPPFGRMKHIPPFFATPRGTPRADDWLILSGIIHVRIKGMPWHQAPEEYGPYMTLHNRWKRWRDKGILERILPAPASRSGKTHTLLPDSTCIRVHRAACSICPRPGEHGRKTGGTRGGLNCKLHIVADAAGRPNLMFLTAGQASDYKGAKALRGARPKAKALVGDRGHNANRFRSLSENMGIDPCIPSRRNRKVQVSCDRELYYDGGKWRMACAAGKKPGFLSGDGDTERHALLALRRSAPLSTLKGQSTGERIIRL